MMQRNVKRLCRWLARPVLLHWLLPYLMALVVAGTVAQKYIGLYDSQRMFFSSFIFWAGPVPLPGGRVVTALLLLGLLSKLITASPWRKATAGIFIAHLGVMLLLLGGMVTATFCTEGYAALEKNESTSRFFDYHRRMLTVSKNDKTLMQIPLADIAEGKVIADAALPFTLTVHAVCHNCTMAPRQSNSPDLHGPAKKVMLSPLADYLEDERNLSGAELGIAKTGTEADGTYIAFEPMEKQPRFVVGKDSYGITLGRADYPLPFALQLLDAQEKVHPGTDVPSSYRSVVMLTDGAVRQRFVITMNHPLRYKGYTVYQASFSGDADTSQTKSVSFAIVQNGGRVFPYIASLTLCLGLVDSSVCLRLPGLIKRHSDAS